MVWDGVDWSSPALVAAGLYQPHAPFAADVIAYSLINAYFAGRHNSVKLIEQPFSHNAQFGEGAPQYFSNTDDFAEISSGYVGVDETFTHLRAIVVFQTATARDTSSHHRVIATDLSTTKTGSTATIPVATNSTFDVIVRQLFDERAAASYNGGVFYAECEVDLGGLDLLDEIYISVEGYTADASFVNFTTYRPLWVAVFAECRG